MTTKSILPVAVIGAGPVGMAAAANLAKRNIPFLLFEAVPHAGSNISALSSMVLPRNSWRSDVFEWLQDGSFEKTDKLPISILLKNT